MEKSVKRHIREYFESFNLSEEQLCRLERLQTDGCSSKRFTRRAFRAPLTKAAMVVLMVGISVFAWNHYNENRQVNQLVAEIVYNHNKHMAMEVNSETLETVKAYLSKLDFPLVATSRLPGDQWQLIGGRYCSLQGKLAAQLKLRQRNTGEIYTLFQTPCPPGMADTEVVRKEFINGIEVHLWAERGLLLGMAGGR